MSSQEETTDVFGQSSAVTPNGSPPPYQQYDIKAMLDTIDDVLELRKGDLEERLEYYRRRLTLGAPSTDLSWEDRVAQSRVTIREINAKLVGFLSDLKLAYDFAAYELVLPDPHFMDGIPDYATVLSRHRHESIASVHHKRANMALIERYAVRRREEREASLKQTSGPARAIHELGLYKARMVASIAFEMEKYYARVLEVLKVESSDDTIENQNLAHYMTLCTNNVVMGAAITFTLYHRFLAHFHLLASPQSQEVMAANAIETALRGLNLLVATDVHSMKATSKHYRAISKAKKPNHSIDSNNSTPQDPKGPGCAIV